MASAARVILAHFGQSTFAFMQLRSVLNVWGIDYIVRRFDDAANGETSAGRQDALSVPPDRTVLIRSWAWPYDAVAFVQTITTSFIEQHATRSTDAEPAIIDILLDRRYSGRSPEPGATRILDASTQPWTSWTSNLRAALRVGRGLKDEAAILESIFSSTASSAYAEEQSATEPRLRAVHRGADATSALTYGTVVGQVVGGYQIDARVSEVDGTNPYVTYHGVRSAPRPAQAEIALVLVPHPLPQLRTEQLREQFTLAMQARRQFRHPSIAPVAEIGETDEYLYAVVPYPAGRTLAETLVAASDAPLPLQTVASYLTQLADAVDSAAKGGIILSDLSLDNAIMDSMGHPAIASVGYPASSLFEWADCISGMGAIAYALVTGYALKWAAPSDRGQEQPFGMLNPELWRRRLDLPIPSEAAILGALRPWPWFSSCAAFASAFRSGLVDLWTENMTPARARDWSTWWRMGNSRSQPVHSDQRRRATRRLVRLGLLAIAFLAIGVGILAMVSTPTGTGPTAHHTGHGATGGNSGNGGGASGNSQPGLVGVISFTGSPTPAPPLSTTPSGTTTPVDYSNPTATSQSVAGPTDTGNTGSPSPGPTGTGNPMPGPTSTFPPVPGPTSTGDPSPGPTTTPTPGPTATPSVACLAAGTTFSDTFATYAIGAPPSGYLLRGAAQAAPSIQFVRGSGQELVFPYVYNQYWESWALKDEGGKVLCGLYTVTAKMTFLTSGDRAGIAIAWHNSTGGYIEIQPNVYWQDIEYRSNLGGTFTPSYGSSLPMSLGVPYWLRAQVTNNTPGAGAVTVLWSTDGTHFSQVGTIRGVSDLNGLAGVGTAGPNLPETAYSLFAFTAG